MAIKKERDNKQELDMKQAPDLKQENVNDLKHDGFENFGDLLGQIKIIINCKEKSEQDMKPYIFNQISELKDHKRTYDAEKPYSGDIYEKIYGWQHGLKRHNTHFSDKPYSCDIWSIITTVWFVTKRSVDTSAGWYFKKW